MRLVLASGADPGERRKQAKIMRKDAAAPHLLG
jgi:hypothetical protein